ncbi:hypothetical protein HP398_06135 [Brevibacillus sp. HB1.4B]|uniref:hypothetical protein n=1 Tax=Brevibacillus sp. HB1.4B TaxID=2738845 RepID=UPI00156BB068|nr:hypothetical protein [Brevibacillus sp. HB1.4B]NRS16012.1 hypothetical protein [Brevibacillus sp. HB1.4B]
MNVIGIIQTDLNEFNVLFEQQGGQGGNGQGQQSQNSGQNNQQDQDSDSMFLSFLDEQPSSNENSGQGNSQGGQQQNGGGPQELTVRIKGIPEGQKANFLQMYQILQDAQDSQTLEKDLTIVDHGDQDQGSQKQGQGQGHGSGKQNKTTH